MAYVITQMCKRAGDCADVCPTESIHTVAGNAEWPLYYINPDTCIDCGACMEECPNQAIFPDYEVPEAYLDDVEKNEAFYTEGPGADLI